MTGTGTIQVTSAQLIIALIGAAGIGALVSASILSFTQWRDRVARRRELLLTKSIDMAQKTTELLIRESPAGSFFYPEIVTARWYHRQLSLLFKTGKIDASLEKEFAAYITQPHSQLDTK